MSGPSPTVPAETLYPILPTSWLPAPIAAPVAGRGRATWYEPAGVPSACGPTFGDADVVAAVSGSLWTAANPNDDPRCGRTLAVTDTADHRSVTVRIEDLCPGCDVDRIELSPAAFAALTDLGAGVVPTDWH